MAFVMFNPNPTRKLVGDCVIRAVAKTMNKSWEDTYLEIVMQGFSMHDMPSSNDVWGTYLLEHGFKRFIIPDSCPDCYTVMEFCDDHPEGIYVVKSENHVATVVNGILYDSWNSEMKTPIYYWTNEKEE